MTSKEFSKKFKKYLKESDERLSKIKVRKGKGTASSWVEVSGSGDYGRFTEQEAEALNEKGILHGLNCAVMNWEDQKYLADKFNL
jgi:hypothetical protein